jgi:DNA replication protein DnaC
MRGRYAEQGLWGLVDQRVLRDPVVAESLLDRLINTSHQILMDGPSYRPRKRPGAKTT